jgi:hypothetical protein
MDTRSLIDKFDRIGARVRISERDPRRFNRSTGAVSFDVVADRHGERFDLVRDPGAEIAVLDVRPPDRHLLIMVRGQGQKQKFLCGHDERHWFVAAIPEQASVGNVRQAKEALKPAAVRDAQSREHLGGRARDSRKNAAYRRQGEWFFLPVPGFRVDDSLILRNEPLRRGLRGKPHWVDFCYRTGGEDVYVCNRHPSGVTPQQHDRILVQNPKARSWNWSRMRRNPGVYVRGRVRHADHRTINLPDWHVVHMNTENQAAAMRNVAFLD